MKLIQPSFTRGEISPSLYARVDLAAYGVGLRTATNFIVRPSGGVVNRPGTQFVQETKTSAQKTRLIPFVVSNEAAYVIELGHLYARFYVNGALLMSGMTPVEVVTPWTQDQIADVRHTQSADVLWMVHPSYAPRKLSRLTATSFALTVFETKDGPFRDINTDESIVVSASAPTGQVTITSSAAIFTAGMVGSYFYLEQKELNKVKPWVVGERTTTGGTLAVGALRRSDGKTYRCSTIPAGPAGTDWTETGSVRPTHETGRAWDGPGDAKDNGTQQWVSGVEWEYIDSGYGVVLITGFTSSTQVTGAVTRRIPAACVGGVGSPSTTWNVVGDGVALTFATAGAVSPSNSDYTVTIDGVPVQSDPYYDPGGGDGILNPRDGGLREGYYIP